MSYYIIAKQQLRLSGLVAEELRASESIPVDGGAGVRCLASKHVGSDTKPLPHGLVGLGSVCAQC